jgi:hypothetical protein
MKKTGKGPDQTSPNKSIVHSEEVNMNDKEGYNETNPDASVNPNQEQKQKAKKMKDQLPSSPDNH